MTKRTFRSAVIAVILTAAGMIPPIEYCMAGPGYGLPMAVIHPSHQEWWLIPLRIPLAMDDFAFDPAGLGIDLLVCWLIVLGISAAVRRRVAVA